MSFLSWRKPVSQHYQLFLSLSFVKVIFLLAVLSWSITLSIFLCLKLVVLLPEVGCKKKQNQEIISDVSQCCLLIPSKMGDGHCLSHFHIHWFISRFHLQWTFIINKILAIIGLRAFESFLKMLNKYYIFLNIFLQFVCNNSVVIWSSLLQFHIGAIQISAKILIRFLIRILDFLHQLLLHRGLTICFDTNVCQDIYSIIILLLLKWLQITQYFPWYIYRIQN